MLMIMSVIDVIIVPTSQSEATVIQSGGNQSRGDDETNQMENYGMYI